MDAPSSNQSSHGNNSNMMRPQNGPGGRGGGPFGYFNNPMFMMPGLIGAGGSGASDSNPLLTSLQYLQGLSYLVYSLGQMFDMIGRNANSIINGYNMIYNMIQKLIHIAKTSEFRKWMQSESKKSKVMRYLFVILSMVATILTMRLFQFVTSHMDLQNQNGRIGF